MSRQLTLFPELALKLVTILDEAAEVYALKIRVEDTSEFRKIIKEAYKDGASLVLGEIIDLLKKYTDVHEV